MARFLPLTVTAIRRETRDAVVLTLTPRPEDMAAFAFVQGQYLTFRRDFDGVELRRSYSICAGLDDGCLQVAVKRVEGGAFSSWVNTDLAPGDILEAMPPAGRFFAPVEGARHYLAFAAGSGITPILSIIRTALAREPGARVTLVYANRGAASIMFREDLEDLKNLHLGRLSVIHVLEQEGQEIELFTGRLEADRLARLFRLWIDPAGADMAFICGPEPMMLAVAASLRDHGMADDRIRFELFSAGQQGRAATPPRPVAAPTDQGVEAAVTLDGTTRRIAVAPGQTLLEAALAAQMDAPWSCRAGVCSTCRCKVTEGAVEMAVNHALEDDEVRAGYVLSCQAVPLTAAVTMTYDA